MRTLLMSLLIIGTCLGLDATECRKRKKEEKPIAVEVFQTRPADKLLCADHKVKRDSNGDRV